MTNHKTMSVRDFVEHLRSEKAAGKLNIQRLCRTSGASRQSVYRLLDGDQCTLKTFAQILSHFDAQITISFPNRPKGPRPPAE
jgi:hypothetical protein